ncbi:hypothetical protein DL93DRAFT_2044979, partial [Clavulina sp. PMI_390]
LHPVFNVNLLEPYTPPSDFPGRSNAPPAPTLILDDNVAQGFAIKEFLDVRRVGRRFDYLVDFVNQPQSERSWLPLSDIPSTYNETLEHFHRLHPKLP